MGEFTEGPWTFVPSEYSAGPDKWHSLVGAKSEVLGPDFELGRSGVVHDQWISASPANARLISAAPDLYEALKAINELYLVDGGGYPDQIDKVQEIARAALTKAKER